MSMIDKSLPSYASIVEVRRKNPIPMFVGEAYYLLMEPRCLLPPYTMLTLIFFVYIIFNKQVAL